MAATQGLYRESMDLNREICELEKFGHVRKTDGDFVFHHCKNCGGPLLGHMKDEKDCNADRKWTKDEVDLIEYNLSSHGMFSINVARIDTRKTAIKCDICKKDFLNRMEKEQHIKIIHKDSSTSVVKEDPYDLAAIIAIGKTIGEQIAKGLEAKKSTQITKAKPPPMWVGQTFEKFRQEVDAWNTSNRDDDFTKYTDLVESLKKNNNVKEYVVSVLLDRTCEPRNKNVAAVLEVLKEKYAKTTAEKCIDVLKSILEFSMKEEDTNETYWDKFEVLICDSIREKISEHLYYLLGIMMVEKAYDRGNITAEEKRRLVDAMETHNGTDRKPREDDEVFNLLKTEYRKLKIENNRNIKTKPPGSSESSCYVHYGENRSRWQRWQNFKQRPDFYKFHRSNSNPGFWRTQSGTYRRAPSRTPSRPSRSSSSRQSSSFRPYSNGRTLSNGRSASNSKPVLNDQKQQPNLTERVIMVEENVAKILEKIEEMMKKGKNVNFVSVEEVSEIIDVDISEVMFAKEVTEVGALMLDTGCPNSLVGKSWLEKYFQKNRINKDDLHKRRCFQKFRFGPSRIYESKEIIEIPITIKETGKSDALTKMFLEAFVVDAENVPLLCGRNTMKKWKMDLSMHRDKVTINVGETREFECMYTAGGHMVLRLYEDRTFWTTNATVFYMKKEVDVESYEKVKKIHEVTNHKSENQLLHAYRNAGKLTKEMRETIEEVCENCNICKKYKRSQGTPKVALPIVSDFNQIVTLDLKQYGETYVLWMICSFTRFIQGAVLKDKTADSVVESLNTAWNWRFGFPSQGYWADNGPEFKNHEVNEFASKLGFEVKFGPNYSPWSNGINERNHYSADMTVKKIREADKKIDLKKAVEMAAWTHNTNTSILGYNPMQLVTGKAVMIPGISTGNVAKESMFDSENVKLMMERHHMITKQFREAEYSSKLKRASQQQNNRFNDVIYQEGDMVFYQDKMKKAWCGPVKVFTQRGRDVYAWANGDLKKIASCKVQLCSQRNIPSEIPKEDNKAARTVDSTQEVADEDRTSMDPPASNLRMKTRSQNNKEEAEKDFIGAFWLTSEKTECFCEEITSYVVELPVKYHKMPEVLEAKKKEYENLLHFDTFEEVEDVGQEKIGSRWVITKKEKHDGQKTDYKGRIVAKGFHEKEKPQADSPTAMRESMKVFLSLAANENFELQSIDIRAAFLQSNILNRHVFVEPPKDLKKENIVWKLRKPLYGLDDASRKFWLRIQQIFKEEGLKNVNGDEAYYYQRSNGNLIGMILTHVDDFSIAGTEEFVKKVTDLCKEKLQVSKIEKNKFRFTGIDIIKTEAGITISMEDYARSLEKVEDIRKGKPSELLSNQELKVFRKYVGKFSWLAANTRPELAIIALQMSKKNSNATLKDLKKVNFVIDKINERSNKVEFTKVDRKEYLKIYGFTDASFNTSERSISGNLILLGSKRSGHVVPIYWKSKTIQKVCHSAKAAETRSMTKMIDNSQFFASQIEQLLFGKYEKKIPIKLYTDSLPMLESAGSTKQVEERLLRNSIQEMKDMLIEGCIESYSWLDGERAMIADVLTKECKWNEDLEMIMQENEFKFASHEDNLVEYKDGEIRLINKTEKQGK